MFLTSCNYKRHLRHGHGLITIFAECPILLTVCKDLKRVSVTLDTGPTLRRLLYYKVWHSCYKLRTKCKTTLKILPLIQQTDTEHVLNCLGIIPFPPPTVGVWLCVYVRGLISRNIIKKTNKQTNRSQERHCWSLHNRYHYCIFLRHQFWECIKRVDSRYWQRLKVARYSFSGSIPPKFEHKLRRHKQRLWKIATTVVSDKDENLLLLTLQWHRSCRSNEMTLLPIFLGTGNCSSAIVFGSFVKFKRNL